MSKKYKLKKDLPDSEVGDIYVYIPSRDAYYKNGDLTESYWMAQNVENNPEWFEEEKKPFVTEDGVELHEGCEMYGVAIQGTNNDTIWKRRFPFDRDRLHTNRKWFASKDKADEYVLMNKPIVSLTDILSVWDNDNFKSPRYYMDAPIFVRIKELAKQKLK